MSSYSSVLKLVAAATLVATLDPTLSVAAGDILDAHGVGVSHVGGVWLVRGTPADGLLTDHDEWGDLLMTAPLAHGVIDGVERRWFANGRPESVRTFDTGRKVGVHLGWWPNGAVRFRTRYTDDRFDGANEAWYDSGTRSQRLEYVAGREAGRQQMWAPDGTLIVNYEMRDGRRYGMINAKPCIPSDGGK
jgi:hypothetical protein